MMRSTKVNLTTNTAGAATEYGEAVVGSVYAVQLIDGDFADNVDVTVTCENENLSMPILVKANFDTDHLVYPRVLQALDTDGSALTTHCEPLAYGRIKVVIAQGGSVKTGAVIVYVRDL